MLSRLPLPSVSVEFPIITVLQVDARKDFFVVPRFRRTGAYDVSNQGEIQGGRSSDAGSV